jgi:hypothetical protein
MSIVPVKGGIEVKLIAIKTPCLRDEPRHQLICVTLPAELWQRDEIVDVEVSSSGEQVLHAKSRHGYSVGQSGEEDAHQSVTFWAQHMIYKSDELGRGPDVRP